MAEEAGSALDASALLAYLQGEPGRQTVQTALASRAVISIVNYAEVLSRLGDAREEPATAHRKLQEQGLIGGLLAVEPLTEDDAVAIARLRATRPTVFLCATAPAWRPASASASRSSPRIGAGQCSTWECPSG